MKKFSNTSKSLLSLAFAALAWPAISFANHSILVEGESDFDGDMLIGLEEDADGDNVFGTFAAALADINNNGLITCVTSGRFGEALNLDADNNGLGNTAGGNIIVQGAPGTDCVIEAFFQGNDPRQDIFLRMGEVAGDANARRQAAPGIVVDVPAGRQVIVRNLTIENWTDCVTVSGESRVVLDGVRCNHNIGVGLRAGDTSFVNMLNSTISAQGFRQTGGVPTQDFPNSAVLQADGSFQDGAGMTVNFDGRGVACGSSATCRLINTVVSGNCRSGIDQTSSSATVIARGLSVANNGSMVSTAAACTGVDFDGMFDFANFLPN